MEAQSFQLSAWDSAPVRSPIRCARGLADCHLHVAHPEDMLEALVSDDKALEAMRASSLSKLAFFVERKREVLQTFVKVSTHIMQEKTLLLEPLM